MPHFGVIQFRRDKCTGCGLCVSDCVRRALSQQGGQCPDIDHERCFQCGHCIAICPTGAVTVTGVAQAEILPIDHANACLTPDGLLHTIRARRSVRQFTDAPIDHGLIAQIIEAGRYTPTGSNRQNVRYIVLEEDADRLEAAALADCAAERHQGGRQRWVAHYMPGASLRPGSFFRGAKAVILIVSSDEINASLAAASMELMAQALGVGALYCGLFARAVAYAPALQEELGIRGTEKLVTCLCLGHTAVRYYRTVPRNPANVTWR